MSFCEKGLFPQKEKNCCRKDCKKYCCYCYCFEKKPCKPHKDICHEVKRHRPEKEKDKVLPCYIEDCDLPYWWEDDCKSPCYEKNCCREYEREYEKEWKSPCCCEKDFYPDWGKGKGFESKGYFEEDYEQSDFFRAY